MSEYSLKMDRRLIVRISSSFRDPQSKDLSRKDKWRRFSHFFHYRVIQRARYNISLRHTWVFANACQSRLRAQSRKPALDFRSLESSGNHFANATKCCLSLTGRSASTCRARRIPKTLADDSSASVSKGIQFASHRLSVSPSPFARLMQDTRCNRMRDHKDGKRAFSLLGMKP